MAVCAATGAQQPIMPPTNSAFVLAPQMIMKLSMMPAINTVVIATRHHLHARQVLAALAAGKNVFCEKPLCLTRRRTDARSCRSTRIDSWDRARRC